MLGSPHNAQPRAGIVRYDEEKKTLHATERDRPDVQRSRLAFRQWVVRVPHHRLIFVDEFGFNLAMAPAYVVASLCEIVDLDAPLVVQDPADAGLRHDGRDLHLFGPELWG